MRPDDYTILAGPGVADDHATLYRDMARRADERVQRAEARRKDAEAERDAALAREDALVRRAMHIARTDGRFPGEQVITFRFDATALDLSRNWREVFDMAYRDMVRGVGGVLAQTGSLK